DIFFRTLRLEETADRMYAEASETSRRWLDAYAEGINAWIAERGGSMPPEVRLLRIEVEPWQPRDGYLFALMMAVDLSFWDDRPEEERFLWLRHFGAEAVRDLLGDAEIHVPEEIAAFAAQPSATSTSSANDVEAAIDDIAPGSNNWAIDGLRAAGGWPILANDPHLGLHLPSVWYQVHLRAPGFVVQGMTLPGTPGVVIGRSESLAWAMTNVMLDDHDVFFEQLDSAAENVLRRDEAGSELWRPIESQEVAIPVRGTEPHMVTLRRTDLGPLLAAEPQRNLPARSLRWTALDGGDPLAALYELAKSKSVDEALAATGAFTCPPQNLAIAFGPDSQDPGALVYTVLGRVPNRLAGDGRLPTPAWNPSYGWEGLRPHETNPTVREAVEGSVLDDGILVTANHDVRPPGYELPLVSEFFPPFRADRIRQRLEERSDWDVAGFADVQMDHRSLFAERLVNALGSDLDGDAERAFRELRDWQGQMSAEVGTADSGAAALFVLVQKHLLSEIFGDEQKAAGLRKSIGHRQSLLRVLERQASDRWWDDVTTPHTEESREEIVQRALDAAWKEGVARWGDDLMLWDHGWLHQLTLRHRLDAVPVLGWWLRRGPWPMPGHATTVQALGARWIEDGARQEITYGPSMRWIVDWSDPDHAWSVLPGGQAGHPADPHYADQMDLYLAGEVHEAPWSESAVAAATVATTRFVP
ncbi:MAG: penicillin acylase family protein, partial [Thermoanaerobaculia bacterium]|nr:penicillin acylase family protein [Thermoanaerobaculia bacterium]